MYRENELINGQYEVRRRLAGGMAYVYIVHDQVSQRTLAIKTLKDELLENRIAVARFEREARTWINLGVHGNIVHAISFQRGKQPLLILEYVNGLNLARVISSEPAGLSATQVLGFATQMADGLAFAHTCPMPCGSVGVVHRDLKPANVMITETAVAKLTDFGLARVQDESAITASGDAMGTFPYMAPEQWKNAHAVTERADIYSLGIMLYEMVAGMRPFPAATPAEIMFQTLYVDPEPIQTYRPDVDDELADLIACCLRKNPEERLDSAQVFGQRIRVIRERLACDSSVPRTCSSCGYVANRKLHHCVVCGATFERQLSAVEENCRTCRCGNRVSAAYRFCTHCGRRQPWESPCGNCGEMNPGEYQFCCRCGTRLADRDTHANQVQPSNSPS